MDAARACMLHCTNMSAHASPTQTGTYGHVGLVARACTNTNTHASQTPARMQHKPPCWRLPGGLRLQPYLEHCRPTCSTTAHHSHANASPCTASPRYPLASSTDGAMEIAENARRPPNHVGIGAPNSSQPLTSGSRATVDHLYVCIHQHDAHNAPYE